MDNRPVAAADHDSALLHASGLSKRFGAIEALRNVSLTVRPGTVVGLCGHNGAGKSTLVKSLVGLVRPDSGEILVHGVPVRLRDPQEAQLRGIALVDQELSLVPALSIADNLFLGNTDRPLITHRRRQHAAARTLLDRVALSHLSPGTPVETLRMGERQLVEIARLLGRNSSVLILDEPTASLSESETRNVFAVIRQAVAEGHGVIYVSHRLDEVLGICDEVVVLRDGVEVAAEPVEGLTRATLIELMLGEAGVERPTPAPAASSGPAVSIRGLTVPGRVRTFDLDLPGGRIVGLAGQLGSGANEVLRAVAGLVPNASGQVHLGEKRLRLGSPVRSVAAGAVYVSNDRQREGLFLGQSTARNLTATRLGAISRLGMLSRRAGSSVVRRLAEVVGVDPRRLRSPVADLSGGNQQKVLIGRCLERDGTKLLLLDDPSRGVDVKGRSDIHRLVRHAAAAGTPVLFASTELDELLELSDVIVTMFRGDVVSTVDRADAQATSVLADMTHARPAALLPGDEP